MTRTELRDQLHKAGVYADDHVTNGSLDAQDTVITQFLTELFKSIRAELKAAGDFGEFDHFDGDEYGEQVAIRIVKRVEESYAGI